MNSPIEQQLEEFLIGRVCLLGIGNRFWHDDGVGSCMARALESCPEFDVVDAGFVPENHLETVAHRNPDTILMIDATDFGGSPGQARLLYPNDIALSGMSTHAGSLEMLAKYLHARTRARVALLAIQPVDTTEGQGLSAKVAQTARVLQKLLPTVGASHARESVLCTASSSAG